MSKKLINLKDINENIFYQLPKQLFYSDTYRTKLSSNAKLLYAIIRDRFNSSIENARKSLNNNERLSFVDKEGNVYCVLESFEIEFTLNITDKTVTKTMKELEEAELIKTVRVPNKAKRIYLYALESDPLDSAVFFGKKEHYSYVRTQKKKKLPIEKTEEEFVAEKINKLMQKQGYQNQNGDGNNTTPETVNNPTPVDVKTPTPGDVNIPPTESENIRHNDMHLNNNQQNNNHNNDIYSNDSSSKEHSNGIYTKTNNLEEEPLQNTSQSEFNYDALDSMLNELSLFMLPKDRNVIKKTLREANIPALTERVVRYAIITHKANVIKMELEEGKGPKYEPAYFANNLVDRYFEVLSNEKVEQEQSQNNHLRQEIQANNGDTVKFYNWLEIREE